jgi:hypothetical protein
MWTWSLNRGEVTAEILIGSRPMSQADWKHAEGEVIRTVLRR